MFDEVVKMIKLFLVLPVTSATAECSFSVLRRLKTYLWSVKAQDCLNNIATLHVHKSLTDSTDFVQLATEFVIRKTNRTQKLFVTIISLLNIVNVLHTCCQFVKLMKAANDLQPHCNSGGHLNDVLVAMWNNCVFFLSQDDKASVPTLVCQPPTSSPQYWCIWDIRVQLFDHDWVMAERHKLIPSVYATYTVEATRVSYSRPTGIFI